jgi:hypothetical protein
MRELSPLALLLISMLIIAADCSSSAGPEIAELADGQFIASVDGRDAFTGDAVFDISVPENEWFPDAYEDPVLFLRLITEELRPEGRPVDYVVTVGVTVNAHWDEDSDTLEIGDTMIRNTFIDPASHELYDIVSGSIHITGYTEGLLAGTVDLLVQDNEYRELGLSGSFRALPED